MQKLTIAVILLTLAACGITGNLQPSAPFSATSGTFSTELNIFRATQGLQPVQQNASLTHAAQAHAADMARRNYFSHQSRGGPNGNNFQQRARAGGCDMRVGAENIASGHMSEAEVLDAWKSSSWHRRNMLVSSYTQYGLGRSGNVWVLKLAAAC